MDSDAKKHLNVAIYVDSDYQLMGAIKFSLGGNFGSNVDLYFSCEIADAEKKVQILERCHVFRKIYKVVVVRYDKRKYRRKLKSILSTIDRRSFEHYLHEMDVAEIRKRHYQLLLMPCASLSCEMFRNYVSHDELGYIDDGYGSYFFDIYDSTMGKLRGMLTKIIHREERPKYLFVNSKMNCYSTTAKEIFDLGAVTSQILEIFKRLYGQETSNSVYSFGDVIYLTQPLNGTKELSQIEESVIRCVSEIFGEKLIIRDHPRMEIRKDNYRHDTQRMLWEYICINNIADSNILVSMGSTAQMTPKLINGKQPYLIFLYSIYTSDIETIKKFQYSYDRIREMYNAPEKVMAPQSIDELRQCLLRLKNRPIQHSTGERS